MILLIPVAVIDLAVIDLAVIDLQNNNASPQWLRATLRVL
jgi:hypothetical protein